MNTSSNTKTPSPITPLSGGWLVNLAMYRAVLAAGFTVSPLKSMAARDGDHWEAILSLSGVKLIVASNDGNGGPNWISPFKFDTPAQTPTDAMAKLLALPEVKTFMLAFDVAVISYEPDPAKLSAEIAELLAKNEVSTDDDAIGQVIRALAEIRKELPKLKKKATVGTHWVGAGADFGNYHSVPSVLDTPENRPKCMAKWPAEFKDFQGFLPDLIAGL